MPVSSINGSGVLGFFFGPPMPPSAPARIFRGSERSMNGVWRASCLRANPGRVPFYLSNRPHLIPSDPGGFETPSLQEHRPLWLETRKRVAGISRPISPGQLYPLEIRGSPVNTGGRWGCCWLSCSAQDSPRTTASLALNANIDEHEKDWFWAIVSTRNTIWTISIALHCLVAT